MLVLALASGCSDSASSDTEADTETAPDRLAEQVAWQQAQERVRTCLEDKGFRAPLGADGEWRLYVPEGGEGVDQARRALSECREIEEVPQPIPLTEDEMRAMHRLLLESHGCLEGLGYALAPPPSQETFVAVYEAAQAGAGKPPWSPYLEVELTATVEAACPQPEYIDLADID